MRTIWKYPLTLERCQKIRMPLVHELLTVQAQRHVPTLWAMVNDRATVLSKGQDVNVAYVDVAIWCFATGDNQGPTPEMHYIATVQIADGTVWHFYQ